MAAQILMFIGGFWLGVSCLLGYMVWRLMSSDGWDDSNITNAFRLLSHVVLHPEDFGKMYYLKREHHVALLKAELSVSRPFWYVSLDEFEGVVRSRPKG